MATLYSRNSFLSMLFDVQNDAARLEENMGDASLPENLRSWLNRLLLLKGVPFNYLVPDERMLPPESIRFFYLDMNWVDTLVDGAFSIGRNLSINENALSMNLDRIALPKSQKQVKLSAHSLRSAALGTVAPVSDLKVVTGFLLRSKLVTEYPGMGVNAYPAGGAPGEGNIQLLDILRMEALGPNSDTMICLIDGDCQRIDVHEAPEVLHYGIDSYSYTANSQKVSATKVLHTFTLSGSQVSLSGNTVNMAMDNTFRSNSPRVVKMTGLAGQIASENNVQSINSAQMGFEMTEGVGMVSFIKQNP